MRVDAIYDHGRVSFKEPVQLKAQRIEIQIIIPDEQIVKDQDLPVRPGQEPATASVSRQQLDALLGKYARHRPGATPAQDKAAWREHLQEEYGP